MFVAGRNMMITGMWCLHCCDPLGEKHTYKLPFPLNKTSMVSLNVRITKPKQVYFNIFPKSAFLNASSQLYLALCCWATRPPTQAELIPKQATAGLLQKMQTYWCWYRFKCSRPSLHKEMLPCLLGTPMAKSLFHNLGTLLSHELSTHQMDFQGEASSLQIKWDFSISLASNGENSVQKAIMMARKHLLCNDCISLLTIHNASWQGLTISIWFYIWLGCCFGCHPIKDTYRQAEN